MGSLDKTGFQEMKFLDELIDQVIILDKSKNVWSENINVETRTIDVHIRRLRQNINLKGSKELIRTVRSAGYSLN